MTLNKDRIGSLPGLHELMEKSLESHAAVTNVSEKLLALTHDRLREEFGSSDTEIRHNGRYYSMTGDGLVSRIYPGNLEQIRNEYRSVNPDLSANAMVEINSIVVGQEI